MIKQLIFIFIGTIFVASSYAQSSKRGIAYGYHSPEDLDVITPQISWWYNWDETPENTVANVFQDYGIEFVPMTWNGSFNETQLRTYLANHPETKYLLAFNEPNFMEQAKMTPTQVAAQWPRLEAIADEFGLEIVGPAVNYCGNCVSENGTTYTDPFEFLDDFFAACPGCRVDYIAVHSYMNTASALEWYMGEFKRYGKPIWLTEFAGWEDNGNINSVDDQIDFMMKAVNFLESDTSIFRYAWFIGRWNNINSYPHIDLLGAKGKLTPLGEVYINMPVHNQNRVVQLPARIEAQEYNKANGVEIVLTTDTSGFAHIRGIQNNDWLEYKIKVPETGTYNIDFRIASINRARLFVLLNGETVLNQTFDRTSGWENWQTFSNSIELPAGTHTLQLKASTANFIINWFEISSVSTGNKLIAENKLFKVFPNPGSGIFNIHTNLQVDEIAVYNLTGTQVFATPFTGTLNFSALPKGIYFLHATDSKNTVVANQKLVVN